MKKQTKSKKSKKITVAAPAKKVAVVHCRRQRLLAFIALAGLFTCGLFVGMAFEKRGTPIQDVTVPSLESADGDVQSDVCSEVERLLLRRLPVASDDVDDRIKRAKVYVSIAERGCIENSLYFAEMARQELEIARAIDNDNFNREETIEMVETYKRLNMQAAAEEIFEKAKKLTDPTIDFIIQMEKIINE